MKVSEYKSYEDLPLFLNAETVSKVLGIAPSSAYELLHEKDFTFPADRQPYRGAQGIVHPMGERTHRGWNMKYNDHGNFFSLPIRSSSWTASR